MEEGEIDEQRSTGRTSSGVAPDEAIAATILFAIVAAISGVSPAKREIVPR